MAKRLTRFLLAALCVLVGSSVVMGQVSNVGKLEGTVLDATGAAVVGADVTIRDDATGAVITTKSGEDGTFVVANLVPGIYTVTVKMQNFKTAEYRNVKIVVGGTYTLAVTLELGAVESTVVVEAGAEVLQTSSATIATTVMGKAITQLPFVSRDALDLAMILPGAATPGRPRTTTIQGLPKGAINITYDGINAQDNINKSSDGFFTTIRPRIDSVEEFTLSTSTQGGEQAAEGAVQMRMETKRGGSEYHGGTWYYLRNDWLNSNYWFNNVTTPVTPRQKQRLSQFGYKIGGPILKDKLFFFHAYDWYKKPESQVRTRTILTAESNLGRFRYAPTSLPTAAQLAAAPWVTCQAVGSRLGAGPECVADLLAMAAASTVDCDAVTPGTQPCPSVRDTLVASIWDAVRSAVSAPGVALAAFPNLFQDNITFNNVGVQDRRFPDWRFDWTATKNHQIRFIYHYAFFKGTPDFLNNRDMTFPVAPFNANQASQNSSRNSFVTGWRWSLSSTMSNDLVFGIVSAPVFFFNDMTSAIYPDANTNRGPIKVRPTFSFISQPFLPFGAFPRNTALGQLNDNFSVTKGKHTLGFGFSATAIYGGIRSTDSAVGGVTVGLNTTNDPARLMFSTTTLPNITATDLGNAQELYGEVTGRVTSFNAFVYLDEKARQFVTGSPFVERYRQNEFGFYGSDSWRMFPTFVLTASLRWEYQGSPYSTNNTYFSLVNGRADVFGVSGNGNLFRPGTLTGSLPRYRLHGTGKWYESDLNNFAPHLGFAWTPNFDNKIWNFFFGGPGKTVFRSGYSITFTREGTGNWLSIVESNPGYFGDQFSNPVGPTDPRLSDPIGNGVYVAGSLRLQNLNFPAVAQVPEQFTEEFDIDFSASHAVNAFNPTMNIPMVQSWSFSIQRELTPNMALEFRYEGNHGTGLWRQFNINEINIFENGFLNEFNAGKNNLAICRANATACLNAQLAAGVTVASQRTANSFANWGLPGQVPLPIFVGAFTGSTTTGPPAAAGNPGSCNTAPINPNCNANFRSATNVTTRLDNNLAGAFATALGTDITSWLLLQQAGFPSNFWRVNPDATGGAFLFTNDTHTTYNALVIELRRRMAKGIQLNANYVWSKNLSNYFTNSGANFRGFTTLRNLGNDKGPTPFDVRHAFKLNLIWEMPFGPGRRFSSSTGWVNRIIEGWEVSTITRWNGGFPFLLTSGLGGTFNNNDPGVRLIGITASQIQDMLEIRKAPDRRVFFFPASLLDASQARGNETFIASCRRAGELCQRLTLYGPGFFKADINVVKRTKVTERVNVEFRAEFLNAFNNANFLYPGSEATIGGGASVQSTTMGRVFNAYRDVSTTDDPGGRIIQLVFRVNF